MESFIPDFRRKGTRIILEIAEFVRIIRSRLPVLIVTGALMACANDPLSPEAALAGSYHASSAAYAASVFTLTQNGSTRDLLAEGGVLDLTLRDDMRTSGRIFVAGADEGGGDFDQNLSGGWSVANDTVRVEQQADTFLRDIPLVLHGNLLSGEFSGPEGTVRVVLVKD